MLNMLIAHCILEEHVGCTNSSDVLRFLCVYESRACIDIDHLCDNEDNCGDFTDENNAYCNNDRWRKQMWTFEDNTTGLHVNIRIHY